MAVLIHFALLAILARLAGSSAVYICFCSVRDKVVAGCGNLAGPEGACKNGKAGVGVVEIEAVASE